MGQQTKIHTSLVSAWQDTVNNNAVWDNAWDFTEHAIFNQSDLNLTYAVSPSDPATLRIGQVVFTGTGTVPTSDAERDGIEILIASHSGFGRDHMIFHGKGTYSKVKYDTTKVIASFDVDQDISLDSTDNIYITVRCEGSSALTADKGRITVQQS